MLDGDAVVRALVLHRCDDPGLRIPPFDRLDSGGAPQRRFPAVGARDESGPELSPIGKRRGRAKRRGRHRVDRERRQEQQVRDGSDPIDQSTPKDAVLDDVAERDAGSEFAMVVMKKQRGIIVGDPDLADRLGVGSNFRPQSDCFENLVRTVADRRAAPVKIIGEQRRGILRVDNRDREPCAGTGDAEQQTVQPATGDQELDIIGHNYPRAWSTLSPMVTGFAAINTKAITHGSVPRLTQLWIVPRCTSTSPTLRWTVVSSSSMSTSPDITMA